jgi:uroporphyrinogen III methyltransferase/synthase
VACYRTVPTHEDPHGIGQQLQNEGADWLTFASGSAVEGFHERFDLPDLLETYPQLKIASIGPETTKALETLSVSPTVEASRHDGEGMVHAIAAHELT